MLKLVPPYLAPVAQKFAVPGRSKPMGHAQCTCTCAASVGSTTATGCSSWSLSRKREYSQPSSSCNLDQTQASPHCQTVFAAAMAACMPSCLADSLAYAFAGSPRRLPLNSTPLACEWVGHQLDQSWTFLFKKSLLTSKFSTLVAKKPSCP